MADPIRIWLEVSHHAAFRVGGWAFVRADGGEVTGRAGGERRIDGERLALTALIAALAGRPAGRPVELVTASPLVAAIPRRIAVAQAGGEAPAADLELWAQALTALAGVRITAAAAGARPTAFCASWAELAREKAKNGAFAAAIPKSNLAKAGV